MESPLHSFLIKDANMQLIDHEPGLNLFRVSPSKMDGDQLIIQQRKNSSPARIANIKRRCKKTWIAALLSHPLKPNDYR